MVSYPVVLERALTANGEIQLQKRGSDFEIIFNGTFLMATYNGESERLLVDLAVEAAQAPRTILVGGLGVGFSLREALRYDSIEKITVVEIEKKIIEWNSTHLAEFSHNALKDPRVQVENEDLNIWLERCPEPYDVICLDIDNGPDWLALDNNQSLYSDQGIQKLLNIMSPSGSISFWSAGQADGFKQRLKQWFNHVAAKEVRQPKGEPDFIYVASQPKR